MGVSLNQPDAHVRTDETGTACSQKSQLKAADAPRIRRQRARIPGGKEPGPAPYLPVKRMHRGSYSMISVAMITRTGETLCRSDEGRRRALVFELQPTPCYACSGRSLNQRRAAPRWRIINLGRCSDNPVQRVLHHDAMPLMPWRGENARKRARPDQTATECMLAYLPCFDQE